MKRTVLTYGFISGAIMALCLCVMSFMFKGGDPEGFKHSMFVGYAFMILGFILVYPAMVSYRDNAGNGVITFGRALRIGLLIMLIGCACYAVAWIIVYHTLMPDFWDKYGQYVIGEMRKSGATPEKIAKQVAQLNEMKESYKNPLMMFGMTFCEPLPIGLPLSLICAGIIKKRKPMVG